MKARHTLTLMLMFSALILISCKKDEANPAAGATNQLVGNWNPQSATVNGAASTPAIALQWVNGTVAARLVVNANASFTYSEMDAANAVLYSESGTFTTNGNSLTLTFTSANGQPVNPPVVRTRTWAIAGNQLTITATEGGNTVVIIYVKV